MSTATLKETQTLRERALAAAREQIAEQEQYRRQRDRESAEHVRQNLVGLLQRYLDIVVSPDDVTVEGNNYHGLAAHITLDGVRFLFASGTYRLQAFIACPECDDGWSNENVQTLADVGYLLLRAEHPHEHTFVDDSTHPNAPPPREQPEERPHIPSLAEQLERVIRAIVRDEQML